MDDQQNFSSSFVNPFAISIFFLLALASFAAGWSGLCIFLLFVTLLFLSSWVWGKYSLKQIKIEISGEKHHISPGDPLSMVFKVHNDKLLPLIWLELYLPAGTNCCLGPIKGYKFTWLTPHQELSWTTSFTAVHRGIYDLKKIHLASGDGFGLCIRNEDYELENEYHAAVYPEIIPVEVSPFLQNHFDASSGGRGIYEDVTLIKNSREYQYGDSARKLNWRMLARSGELQVNIFETIRPCSVFFILDLESYRKVTVRGENLEDLVSSYKEELESDISLIASLVLSLKEHGMQCGLAIPGYHHAVQDQEKFQKSVFLLAGNEDGQWNFVLYQLAAIDYHGEKTVVDEEQLLSQRENLGQIYLVTRSEEALTCLSLMDKLEQVGIKLLTDAQNKASRFPLMDSKKIKKIENRRGR